MRMLLFLLACGGASDPVDTATAPPTAAPTGATGASAATGDTATTDPCSEGEPTFTPGVGSYAFEPLDAGDTLTIIQGPQGGYHVDWAGIVGPMPAVGVVLLPEIVLDADGSLFAATERGIQDTFDDHDPATCTGTFTGTRLFIDGDAASLCALEGAGAQVTLTVEDFAGRSTSVTLPVTLSVDLLDPYTCATLSIP